MADQGRGSRRDIGAHSVRDDDRKRRRGFLLPLLALLALLALIALFVSQCGGDDDDNAAQTPTTEQTQPSGGAAAGEGEAEGEGGEAGGTGGTGAGAGDGGTLTAGETDVLAAQTADAAAVGQTAEGRGLVVTEVVEDEGFFVGRTADDPDRVYVEFGGDVGEDEQGFTPKVGDTVDLDAEVRPAPEDPQQTLNLSAQQAEPVSSRGFFVNATEVRQAQG